MTDRSEWPQWLQDADTANARVTIVGGLVVWCDGVWRGGVWRGGEWRGGEWCGGTSTPRSTFRVTGRGKYVYIGCQRRTIEQWDAIVDGAEAPREAPPRGSEQWRLLVAHYKAQRAWQLALMEDDA